MKRTAAAPHYADVKGMRRLKTEPLIGAGNTWRDKIAEDPDRNLLRGRAGN